MLLEFKVWGSKEWYEQAIPMLEELGLQEVPDLGWSDPDSDGELMGRYYDYTDKGGVDPAHLADVLARIRKLIMDGEAPSIEVRLVSDPKRK